MLTWSNCRLLLLHTHHQHRHYLHSNKKKTPHKTLLQQIQHEYTSNKTFIQVSIFLVLLALILTLSDSVLFGRVPRIQVEANGHCGTWQIRNCAVLGAMLQHSSIIVGSVDYISDANLKWANTIPFTSNNEKKQYTHIKLYHRWDQI